MSADVYGVVCPDCHGGDVDLRFGSKQRFSHGCGPGTLWFSALPPARLSDKVAERASGVTTLTAEPSQMEAYRWFVDDWGHVLDRSALTKAIIDLGHRAEGE